MKNNLYQNSQNNLEKKIKWEEIQKSFKEKFGLEIYESWLKKIEFLDEFRNHILLSVGTRFIRDWITSRYLDQILKIIKSYKKEIVRIEFIISSPNESKTYNKKIDHTKNEFQNVSFIKDTYLQYNRIDPNKSFENFIVGNSNKLAFEAANKVSEEIAHYNPLD